MFQHRLVAVRALPERVKYTLTELVAEAIGPNPKGPRALRLHAVCFRVSLGQEGMEEARLVACQGFEVKLFCQCLPGPDLDGDGHD